MSFTEQSLAIIRVTFAALWVGLVGYTAFYAPTQDKSFDMSLLGQLVGLQGIGKFLATNPVVFAMFNVLGVYPALFAALLLPAGRSATKVPAWPFITASLGMGAFGLLPFMAQWRPLKKNVVPPPASELRGWSKTFMIGAETIYLPLALLATSLLLVWWSTTGGGAGFTEFVQLFKSSFLINVMTLDCAVLTVAMPFWMWNDAQLRNWSSRATLVPILSCIPVVGPALYLVLRPKTF